LRDVVHADGRRPGLAAYTAEGLPLTEPAARRALRGLSLQEDVPFTPSGAAPGGSG